MPYLVKTMDEGKHPTQAVTYWYPVIKEIRTLPLTKVALAQWLPAVTWVRSSTYSIHSFNFFGSNLWQTHRMHSIRIFQMIKN